MIEEVIFILLGLSVIIPIFLIVYSRRYSSYPATFPYQVLMGLISLWALLYLLDLAQSELSLKILIQELRFLVIPYVPISILWLFLVLIDKKQWISGWRGMVILVVPIVSSALAITSQHHELFRYGYWISYTYAIPILKCSIGPAYILYSLYSYAIIIIAVSLLLYYGEKSHNIYRIQLIIIASLQLIGLFPQHSPSDQVQSYPWNQSDSDILQSSWNRIFSGYHQVRIY